MAVTLMTHLTAKIRKSHATDLRNASRKKNFSVECGEGKRNGNDVTPPSPFPSVETTLEAPEPL